MRFGAFLLVLFLAGCETVKDEVDVSQEGSGLLLTSSHGGDGSAWGLPECGACHAMAAIHQNVATGTRGLVEEKGYGTCTGCHGTNGTEEERACLVCHNATDLAETPYQDGLHRHGFGKGTAVDPADADCLVCHDASDMDGSFEPAVDLARLPDEASVRSAASSIPDFCVRCHNRDHQQSGYEISVTNYDDPLAAVEDSYRYIDQHGWVDGSGERTYAGLREGYQYRTLVACTDCHAMHGTANEALIVDGSHKGASRLDPAFRAQAFGVAITDGRYGQLCVLCHAMEYTLDSGAVDTGNGLAGVHEVETDCRPCHSHGEAVQAGL